VPAPAICVVVTPLLTLPWWFPIPPPRFWTGFLSAVGSSNVFLYRRATYYFGSMWAAETTFTQTWYLGVDLSVLLIFSPGGLQCSARASRRSGSPRFRLG